MCRSTSAPKREREREIVLERCVCVSSVITGNKIASNAECTFVCVWLCLLPVVFKKD